MALGNIERGRKKFADCADTYTQAIDAMPRAPDKNTWVTYYYRGICEERSKQWSKAEADMRKALEMQPEQPHVLNYLGYSWIDQGINLDEGMKMIKRAVDQRPDDGYIVDSLGWAYYRIGNYDEAVKISSARSTSSRRIRPSTTISATPIGGSGARSKPSSSGPMRATSSRRRRNCRRSRPRSPTVFRMTPLLRPPPTRRRRRQGRLRQRIVGGCSSMPALM